MRWRLIFPSPFCACHKQAGRSFVNRKDDMTEPLYIKRGGRYVPVPVPEDELQALRALRCFDPHTLIIGAARYYMGRMTIAACWFAEHELARAWDDLPAGTRRVIQRDITEAFERDDEARASGARYLPLGADCDRKAWDAVRRKFAGQTEHQPRQAMSASALAWHLRALAESMDEISTDLLAHEWAGAQDMRDWAAQARRWADEIKEQKT